MQSNSNKYSLSEPLLLFTVTAIAISMENNDLFASLVSDIKTYSGKDPLLPWIRGIRKMKDSLPSQVLKEKLPRFLQKCAQTFESDRRYRNDLRYLRVWLQLMDFVDDPRAVLKAMESNFIGTKHSLFYQAYALYYEKGKKFDEAEKIYHLGVQNLAEPADELQKSYEQFLRRIQRQKKRLEKAKNRHHSDGNVPPNGSKIKENNKNEFRVKGRQEDASKVESLPRIALKEKDGRSKEVLEGYSQQAKPLVESNHSDDFGPKNKHEATAKRRAGRSNMSCTDDTVVVKFVGTAIGGRSETENALHHGLVDPTINMKEAMNAINSMFSEPLEIAPVGRSRQRRSINDSSPDNGGFEVFIDEDLDKEIKPADNKKEKSSQLLQHNKIENHRACQEPLSIFVDDDENDKAEDENLTEYNTGGSDIQNSREDCGSDSHRAFVFPTPKDLPSESSDDVDVEGPSRRRFREDTVVCRFVGSAISDEPEVENVCHHGLVDPTINLKEAMEDINNMFGKPIDFVRAKRSKKRDKAPDTKNNFGGGFTILADDDLEHEPVKPVPKSSRKSRGCDLFEPTIVTREAIDDINKMFGMPLDF